MAMSFSRPDPSSPTAVSTASFTTSRKGYEQAEVRDFLRMVAAELARLQERERFLERELRVAQRGHTNANVALDEEVVTRLLGEEAARILSTAREAASQIKVRAEEGAARVLREATDEAQRLREEAEIEAARRRQDASADAEAELSMAKQQGRDMVNEARAYRERVLNELARRREMARQQIEQLVHGRDRLLQAFERARLAAVDVMAEMTPLAEPNEYVNLAPTTGPVPLMVPAKQVEADPAESPAEPAVDEIAADVEAEAEPEVADEPEPADVEAEPAVVELDISPGEHDDGAPDTGSIAPVVALFAGEMDTAQTADTSDAAATADDAKPSVDDLFARLRASRTEQVAAKASAAGTAETAESEPGDATEGDAHATDAIEVDAIEGDGGEVDAAVEVPDSTEELSVFQPSPAAPAAAVEFDDSAFGRRDAELTPLITAGARKLKRVLADEQNDVLHALRRVSAVRDLDELLAPQDEHIRHYADAIEGELTKAAMAGAASIDDRSKREHTKAVGKSDAVAAAVATLGSTIVMPLRDRLERAVADAGDDTDDLVGIIRAVYREWKTQRIDEHLDDVARTAFGHGQLAVLEPGTPVCWVVDPNGPDCPDAEDNALAGVVNSGDPFPTDHRCAPAHEGCRCMLQRAPR